MKVSSLLREFRAPSGSRRRTPQAQDNPQPRMDGPPARRRPAAQDLTSAGSGSPAGGAARAAAPAVPDRDSGPRSRCRGLALGLGADLALGGAHGTSLGQGLP